MDWYPGSPPNHWSYKHKSPTPEDPDNPSVGMDPFQIRIKFSAMLEHMNAALVSSQKCAAYALKYKDFDEDLHSCILEQMQKASINKRANLLYFLEQLVDLGNKENHLGYAKMIQRDIVQIVDAIAPEGTGIANAMITRKMLPRLRDKGVLENATVDELTVTLREREFASGEDFEFDEPWDGKPIGKLSKRDIEQRIEDDRERHKRVRENLWAVNATNHAEWEQLVRDTSPPNSDDDREAREQHAEHQKCKELAIKEAEERRKKLGIDF